MAEKLEFRNVREDQLKYDEDIRVTVEEKDKIKRFNWKQENMKKADMARDRKIYSVLEQEKLKLKKKDDNLELIVTQIDKKKHDLNVDYEMYERSKQGLIEKKKIQSKQLVEQLRRLEDRLQMEVGKHVAYNDKAKRELENELDKLQMMKNKFARD